MNENTLINLIEKIAGENKVLFDVRDQNLEITCLCGREVEMAMIINPEEYFEGRLEPYSEYVEKYEKVVRIYVK